VAKNSDTSMQQKRERDWGEEIQTSKKLKLTSCDSKMNHPQLPLPFQSIPSLHSSYSSSSSSSSRLSHLHASSQAPTPLILNFDGSSLGNPGNAGMKIISFDFNDYKFLYFSHSLCISLSVSLSVNLICQSHHLSMSSSVNLITCQSHHLSISSSVNLIICQSHHLSISSSVNYLTQTHNYKRSRSVSKTP
jgi:hypothetical protein